MTELHAGWPDDPPRYKAEDGHVLVRQTCVLPGGGCSTFWRRVGGALTANGRDLERYEAVRQQAVRQRERAKT